VKAAGLAVWAIALVVVGGFFFVACGAVAAIVCVRRGSGSFARFGVGDFSRPSFFSVPSNFNKFRMEGREMLNPLGVEKESGVGRREKIVSAGVEKKPRWQLPFC
jgi:hypothetical protein